MALFGFGKDKKGGPDSSEQILAYLEDAQRTKAVFTLVGPRKAETSATIQSIDEAEGLFTFQVSPMPGVEKGTGIDFTFIQESLRLGAATRVADLRAGLWVLDIPDTLELRERRGQPRARLNPKEGTTLTALTGIFDGVGITGVVENLSETGARVRVEKALNIKGEKRLPLGTALVPAGQAFMLIKLNKAPKCQPTMELEGRAVFLDAGSGLVMGVAFDQLKPDQASAIRGLVASRTSAIPSVLPPKARRKPEAPAAQPDPRPAPAAPRPPAPEAAQAEAAAPAAALKAEAPAPEAAIPRTEAPGAPAPKNDTLIRLRKRSRGVVALAPSPAFADMLKDHLQEEGYGRALVTASRKEILEFLQQPNLGVLLIDGNLGPLEGLQFLTQLKAAVPNLPPIVLAVEEASAAIVLAAHRNGVAQVLIKPYNLDAALSELINQLI